MYSEVRACKDGDIAGRLHSPGEAHMRRRVRPAICTVLSQMLSRHSLWGHPVPIIQMDNQREQKQLLPSYLFSGGPQKEIGSFSTHQNDCLKKKVLSIFARSQVQSSEQDHVPPGDTASVVTASKYGMKDMVLLPSQGTAPPPASTHEGCTEASVR